MSNEFDFDTKNGWKHYADAASQEQMDVLATRYMDFLSHAKTERETVDLVVEALKAAGFSEDFKKDLVFRTYRGKAVFVARKGKKPLASGVRLISAHTAAWPACRTSSRSACTPTPRALTSNSAHFRNRWVSGKPRPITTAASANISGWPGLSPCTA